MAKASSSAAMDADFLKHTVGNPLSEALTSLVVAQPADPIEYIGEALLEYIKRMEAETKRNNHAAEVVRLLAVFGEKQEIEASEKAIKEEAVQAKITIEKGVEAVIAKATSHAEVYNEVVNLMKGRLAATGIHVGRKVAVEGQEIIEFIAESEGRAEMVGQELRGLREGEDPEDGAGEEGVTFDLWKNTELPPPPEPVFDEEGELIVDENEPELIPPEHLLVENVVRDPRVKFFGIPKMGSYLALPITYGSWLQPGGISDTPPPSQDEPPEEEGRGGNAEAEADPTEKTAEGAVGGAEERLKTPPSLYSKNDAPVQLVLCADTIGQGRCFSASEIIWAKQWADKMKVAVEALESRMFDDEAALLPSLRGVEVSEVVAKAAEGEESDVAEALAALEEGTSEEHKERVSKAVRYRTKVKMVEAVGELIGHMGKLNLAPPSPALEVLERALLLLGKARADLCDTRGTLDWSGKMRTVVSTELVPTIMAFKSEDPALAVLAAEAKEAMESIDAESVKAANIPASAILGWMSSAISEVEDAAAEAAAVEVAAEAAAEAAAAEEAEAAEAAAAAAEEAGEAEEEG